MGMIHSLRVRFQGSEVLRLEGVALPARGVLAVLGKGGSGKSTLLRALAGRLTAAHDWDVRLEAKDIPLHAIFVPQRRRSGGRCRESSGPPPCAAPVPPECLFGASGSANGSAGTCATAWTALLRNSLRSPTPMLLLDEPEGGVPNPSLENLAQELLELKTKTVILLVTHNIAFAERVCDTALFLEDGRNVLQAERQEFFLSPLHPRVQEFLKWGG